MHVIAAKAVAFKEAMTEGFRVYQLQIVKNARALAATLQEQGLRIVSGGTDNHLMLCDLRPLTISGRDAANMLEEAGIIVNKNSIPYDHQPPAIASGIRPGTPAITTRGMKEPEMALIGEMMGRVLRSPLNREIRLQVREEVRQLCARFPVYDDLGVD